MLLAGQATDSMAAARRIVAAASLAAQEYGLGVAPEGGRILAAAEVEESRLFMAQSRFDVPLLPVAIRAPTDSDFTLITAQLDRLAPPAEVEASARRIISRVAAALGQGVEPLPTRQPSVERGARVYRAQCVECHGARGKGDGPKAAHLEGPPPPSLADSQLMAAVAPVDVFRRVTIGVPGTAMPEFEEALSIDDRWAVTAYVMTLSGGSGSIRARGGADAAQVFTVVRRQVDSAVTQRSSRLAFDAYLTFEGVETQVRARDAALAGKLEGAFGELRERVTAADGDQLRDLQARLFAALERAERVVADESSGASLFAQSLILMVREGFEAILIIGALMAFLTKAGAEGRRRDVALGAWAAVAASVVTWGLVELLFEITPAQREALEGATMLLAMGVLFYVSYWLLSKVEVARWNAFVKGKMEAALSAGSGLALGAVAFLAVYREGFETILFYKALLGSSGVGGVGAVVAGIAGGAVLLVGIYVAIKAFGFRLPMKPFFALTGGVLYYMAFVFAGKGVAALQTAGLLELTPVMWSPRVPFLGVYPTVESLALQGMLAALAAAAFAWLRLTRPTSAVPPATPPAVPATSASGRAAPAPPRRSGFRASR